MADISTVDPTQPEEDLSQAAPQEPQDVDDGQNEPTPPNQYPVFVQWSLDNATCTVALADQWTRDLTRPDTTVTSLFGVDRDTLMAVFLPGPDDSDSALKFARKELTDEFAVGLYDETTGVGRATKEELVDLLSLGALRCRAQWTRAGDPFPHLGQMHMTLQGRWSHPYIPAFKVLVVINEEDVMSPELFNCSGVLGPNMDVIQLNASYNPLTKSLVLNNALEPRIQVVHTCNKDLQRIFEKGAFNGLNQMLVDKKVLNAGVLPLFDNPTNAVELKSVLLRAQQRLLETEATNNRDKLEALLRKYSPSQGGQQPRTQFENTDALLAMDQLRLADPNHPLLDSVDVAIDNAMVLSRLRDTRRRNDGRMPRDGGARAAWLAKVHWLDVDSYDLLRKKNKNGMLDDTHREYLSFLQKLMRQPEHPNYGDKGKWRRLEAKIDMLTELINHTTTNGDETDVPAAVDEETGELPAAQLQVQADQELVNRHQEVVQGDELPEVSADGTGAENVSSLDYVEDLVNTHKTPESMWKTNGNDGYDRSGVVVGGSVVEKAMRSLLNKDGGGDGDDDEDDYEPKAASSSGRFNTVARQISSKQGVSMRDAKRILGASNAKYAHKHGR